MSGALLRRRDQTARPLRVDHNSPPSLTDRGQSPEGGIDLHIRDVRAPPRPYSLPDPGPRPRRRGGKTGRNFCYPPDYINLRNRLDIRDASALEVAKREHVAFRLLEPVPAGDFNLDHVKAIHHLFQDTYAWAGEVLTLEIAKGESRFQPRR